MSKAGSFFDFPPNARFTDRKKARNLPGRPFLVALPLERTEGGRATLELLYVAEHGSLSPLGFAVDTLVLAMLRIHLEVSEALDKRELIHNEGFLS